MQDTVASMIETFGHIFSAPSLGGAELLVALLMAGGFLMIGISSFLPKKGDELEWWERR